MFFIFKCGCLSRSNDLNLQLEIEFLKKFGACKNFKIFGLSVLIIVVLYMTLKRVIFFTQLFTMQLGKVNSSPEMFQKNKAYIPTQFLRFFFSLRWLVLLILIYWVGVQQGQSYLMWIRCLFSFGWPPF